MKLFKRLLMAISLILAFIVGVQPQTASAQVNRPARITPIQSVILAHLPRPANVKYDIKSGDTLSSIAESYKTTWQSLYCGNKAKIGDNPNIIDPNVWIKIPHTKVSCRIVLPAQPVVNSTTTETKTSTNSTTPVTAPSPKDSLSQIQQIAWNLLDGNQTQFDCLDGVINIESGWNVYAENPSSGAYGIPQALPGDKMAKAGPDWQTNPNTQLIWMIDDYIAPVYGNACNALQHEYDDGWY